jgi:hypothetical protein
LPRLSRKAVKPRADNREATVLALPLAEGLAGTAWEPSKLPNYVSITPPSLQHGSVSHYPPTLFPLSLMQKTGRWIISRIVIVILTYQRHKTTDIT